MPQTLSEKDQTRLLNEIAQLARETAPDATRVTGLLPDLLALLTQQAEELEIVRGERDRADKNLRASQAQLVQSGKMAAVGQLAAGVAHEVNNPLQIILSRVQLLMMRNRDHDPLVKDLQLIESNVKRISRIIRSLLDFARHNSGEDTEWQHIDLAHLAGQTIELMRHLGDKGGVALTVHNRAETPPVICGNVGEIEQVFLNLLINALQATSEGGRIDIDVHTHAEGVIARISDTGKGIAPENVPRIFEPFFTTRGNQGGTGLGLAIISGIIDKHKGTIAVESREGEGTTFTLTFPAREST